MYCSDGSLVALSLGTVRGSFLHVRSFETPMSADVFWACRSAIPPDKDSPTFLAPTLHPIHRCIQTRCMIYSSLLLLHVSLISSVVRPVDTQTYIALIHAHSASSTDQVHFVVSSVPNLVPSPAFGQRRSRIQAGNACATPSRGQPLSSYNCPTHA